MSTVRAALGNAAIRMGVGLTRLLPPALWLRVRERSGVVLPLDYRDGQLRLHVESWIEYRVRLRSCAKEPATVAWIEQWVRPGEVLYDVGANVGAYALVAFLATGGKVRVYAFEPGFATFPQLVKNIDLNRATAAIVPLQLALSDCTGLTDFHYQNLVPGGALHALGEPRDQRGATFTPVVTHPVMAYRLDELIERFGLPHPNHIKIDVDGPEAEVLSGAGRTLDASELRSLLIETDPRHRDAGRIEQLLHDHGFVCRWRRGENALFCRPHETERR